MNLNVVPQENERELFFFSCKVSPNTDTSARRRVYMEDSVSEPKHCEQLFDKVNKEHWRFASSKIKIFTNYPKIEGAFLGQGSERSTFLLGKRTFIFNLIRALRAGTILCWAVVSACKELSVVILTINLMCLLRLKALFTTAQFGEIRFQWKS
ncbi:hypothetical protein Bhyg_01525 [Pseudolycoriella hygida]|uniref:Uncharacterized protein n=1 Tax=Pseudolycoriella hygida TaxID=35572 RepID=A0A9Q0S5W3_9DIPT|nr:hypothetical protein Bhyg_01525 [Pseudolycoriella hygida]